MRMKFRAECTEWDSQLIAILDTAAKYETDKRRLSRYSAAIRAIGMAYLERSDEKMEREYTVNIAYSKNVVANNKDEAVGNSIAELPKDAVGVYVTGR